MPDEDAQHVNSPLLCCNRDGGVDADPCVNPILCTLRILLHVPRDPILLASQHRRAEVFRPHDFDFTFVAHAYWLAVPINDEAPLAR